MRFLVVLAILMVIAAMSTVEAVSHDHDHEEDVHTSWTKDKYTITHHLLNSYKF